MKKSFILLVIAAFIVSTMSCGLFGNKYKKRRGKRRGHYRGMMINQTPSTIATVLKQIDLT